MGSPQEIIMITNLPLLVKSSKYQKLDEVKQDFVCLESLFAFNKSSTRIFLMKIRSIDTLLSSNKFKLINWHILVFKTIYFRQTKANKIIN